MKIQTENERLARMNENLSKQVELLEQQAGSYRGAIQAQRLQITRLRTDLIHMMRAIRIVKASMNGIRIPGADDYNVNHNVVNAQSSGSEIGG